MKIKVSPVLTGREAEGFLDFKMAYLMLKSMFCGNVLLYPQ